MGFSKGTTTAMRHRWTLRSAMLLMLSILPLVVLFWTFQNRHQLIPARSSSRWHPNQTKLNVAAADFKAVEAASPDFQFVIKVMTYDRLESTARALHSLRNASYENSKNIALDIYIDHAPIDIASNTTSTSETMLNLVYEFDWPHGIKRIHHRQSNVGTQGQWLEAWYPSSLNEFAFFVEDDMVVSPYYFIWLKQAILHYYYKSNSPSIYGISLQRNNLVPGLHNNQMLRGDFPNDNKPLLKPLVGTWGQLMFPSHWTKFRQWYDRVRYLKDYSPSIDGLITSQWYKMRGEKIWTPWFIKFIQVQNWYNIYANMPNRQALSISYQEKGVNYEKSSGPDNQLYTNYTKNILNFPQLNTLTKYDLCHRKVASGVLAQTHEELASLVKKIALDNTITLTLASRGFESLLRNFLCYVDNLNLRNLLIISDDQDFAEQLLREDRNVYYVQHSNTTAESVHYGTIQYQSLIFERTKIVDEILNMNISTLIADNDAVWRKDPFPYLRQPNNADIVGAMDYDRICGGFLFLNPTKLAKQLWSTITTKHQRLLEQAMKVGHLNNIDESEQSLLKEELITYKKQGLVVHELDWNFFPNGYYYFQAPEFRPLRQEVVVVHANFMIGKDAKVKSLKDNNLWKIDRDLSCTYVRC